MAKDRTGSSKSNFITLGASNHSDYERADEDYYATHPLAVELLLGQEPFTHTVWECASGGGHISEVLYNAGITVVSTDIIDRGYNGFDHVCDFLNRFDDTADWIYDRHETFDIITNPPFAKAAEFVYRAMDILQDGRKLALLLRIQFLEGQERRSLFEQCPPKTIYVPSKRLLCARNGEFEKFAKNSGAMCLCWFVWEKGFNGDTIIKWIN